jgi:hypothetical protein
MRNFWYEEVPATERLMQGDLILASASPLNTLLRQLDGYLRAENYNGFVLRLDGAAHTRARTYLEDASNVTVYPMPELTPDGDGGIDIEWENKGRHLALSVMAGQPDFISWREVSYDIRRADCGADCRCALELVNDVSL